MKSRITFLVLLTLPCIAFAFAPDGDAVKPAPDLSGIYEIDGIDARLDEDGEPIPKRYAGIAVVRQVEEGYFIQWVLSHGSYTGIGAVDGGSLIVSWSHKGNLGLNAYKIGTNDRGKRTLAGRWMATGQMRWYDESLTYMGKFPTVKEQ